MGKENTEKNTWPVKENGVWRVRTDKEFMDLCSESYVISEIRKGRF